MSSTRHSKRIAFVTLDDVKDRLTLSFRYNSEVIKDRLFMINRLQHEPLDASLKRLQYNMLAAIKGKTWRKLKINLEEGVVQNDLKIEDIQFPIFVEDSNGKVLEPYVLNRDAFRIGHFLSVGGVRMPIMVNVPTVEQIYLPKSGFIGFPVRPYISLKRGVLSDCAFSWWRDLIKGENIGSYNAEDVFKDKSRTWLRIVGETGSTYTPVEDDEGHKLRVCCEPRDGERFGVEVDAISEFVVASAPVATAFLERLLKTQDITTGDSVRIVSYNILADTYARSTYAKTVLFNYCPAFALEFDYRRTLLLKEILGYNGDLVCLQEVGRHMFTNDLYPILSEREFDGIYEEKGGSRPEGIALFFRRSKFELVESYTNSVFEAIQNEECLKDVRDAISRNKSLCDRLSCVKTVLMRCVFRHTPSESLLVVCNTHLYFSPDADHIRLLQGLVVARLSQTLQKKFLSAGHRCGVVICGDFNSCPKFGVYKLFTEGFVPHDFDDWKSNEDEKVTGLDARIQLKLSSAYGTPPYTNYTPDFHGCLDYIFHTEDLQLESVVPLPPHESVAHPKYRAIPSPSFPSDHLALVATLKITCAL